MSTRAEDQKPPLKRTRQNTVDCELVPELPRSVDFWFPDGSVVLVANQMAYRVHEGVLAKDSPVFRDMFSAPAHGWKRFDDCPAEYLSDTREDVETLLNVLYNSRSYFRPDRPASLHLVESLLRVCHKYEIDDLRKDSLGRMKTYFPDKFVAYETIGLMYPKYSPRDTVVAVNIARLFPDASMLPIALYRCAQLDIQWLLPANPPRIGPMETLGEEDMKTCLNARVALTRENTRAVYQIFRGKKTKYCLKQGKCAAVLKAHWDVYKTNIGQDALSSRRGDLAALAASEEGLCRSCWNWLVTRDIERRRRIWKLLPQIMGVEMPGWGEEESAEPLSGSDHESVCGDDGAGISAPRRDREGSLSRQGSLYRGRSRDRGRFERSLDRRSYSRSLSPGDRTWSRPMRLR